MPADDAGRGSAGQHDAHRTGRFSRAASHSSRVRVLRWLVPAAAVLALAGVAGAMVVTRLVLPGVDVDIASSAIVDGQLVIADPRLEGFTPDARAYRVSAQSATQRIGGQELALRALSADFELEDGSTAFLTARTGTFDPSANRLLLGEEATLETTAGVRAEFSQADIDLQAGRLHTRMPVRVSQPGMRIAADSLSVEDGGRRFVFENSVSVVIDPSAVTARAETE